MKGYGRYLPYLLFVPSFAVIIFVIIIPLLNSLYLSFTDYVLLMPGSGKFIGLDNYIKMLFDAVFYQALKNTILLMLIAVNVELWVGLGIALLLYKEFLGRQVVIPLLITPMTLAPIVVGLQFKWLFNEIYGVINYILTILGIIKTPVAWLVMPNIALIPILIAEI